MSDVIWIFLTIQNYEPKNSPVLFGEAAVYPQSVNTYAICTLYTSSLPGADCPVISRWFTTIQADGLRAPDQKHACLSCPVIICMWSPSGRPLLALQNLYQHDRLNTTLCCCDSPIEFRIPSAITLTGLRPNDFVDLILPSVRTFPSPVWG